MGAKEVEYSMVTYEPKAFSVLESSVRVFHRENGVCPFISKLLHRGQLKGESTILELYQQEGIESLSPESLPLFILLSKTYKFKAKIYSSDRMFYSE